MAEYDFSALDQFYNKPDETQTEEPTPAAAPVEQPPVQDDGSIAGQGGTVRAPIQAGGNALAEMLQPVGEFLDNNVNAPIQDLIDNTIGGDKRSLEQIRKDIPKERKGRQEHDAYLESQGLVQTSDGRIVPKGEEQKGALETVTDVLLEPQRVIAGSGLGAVESVLQAGEIIGDTARTFAAKFHPSLYSETDDPFNSKYDWVKWDLGKDSHGAQTGVGKIAQGFGEFGLLLWATGGFASLPAVGTKLAAAPTLISKLPIIAKAGLYEGLTGIAADMIISTGGEGNLSNLIQTYAPEIYPDFLLGLAIDEDDNPWESAFKVSLEGFGLGSLIGSAGAFFAGHRAARKLGPKATKFEKEAAATAAATKKLEEDAILDYNNAVKSPLGQIGKVILRTGDTARFEKWGRVFDQQSKGIPVTYDDIAEIVPEYFVGGPRKVFNELHPTIYDAIESGAIRPNTAITFHPFRGVIPTKGYLVTIDGEVLTDLSADSVAAWIAKNEVVLSRVDTYINVKRDKGDVYLELTRVLVDPDTPPLNRVSEVPQRPTPVGIDSPPPTPIGREFEAPKPPEGFTGEGTDEQWAARDLYEKQLAEFNKEQKFAKDLYEQQLAEYNQEQTFARELYQQQVAEYTTAQRNTQWRARQEARIIGTIFDQPVVENLDPDFIRKWLTESEWRRYSQAINPRFQRMQPSLKGQDVHLRKVASERAERGDMPASNKVAQEEVETAPKGDVLLEGSDSLKTTKGLHIASMTEVPSTSTNKQLNLWESAENTQRAADFGWDSGTSSGELMTERQKVKFKKAETVEDAAKIIEETIADAEARGYSNVELTEQGQYTKLQMADKALVDLLGVMGKDGRTVDWAKWRKTWTGKFVSKEFDEPLLTLPGTVGTRELIKGTADYLKVIANSGLKKGDQGDLFIQEWDRMQEQLLRLIKAHKVSSNFYSNALRASSVDLELLGQKFDIDIEFNLDARTLEDTMSEAEEVLDNVRTGLLSGDPKAKREAYYQLTAIQLADGDPTKTLKIGENLRALQGNSALSLMYDSLLSSPATHMINIISNAFNTVYRPFTLYWGGGAKEQKQAIAAFYSFNRVLEDSWQVGRKVWKDSWDPTASRQHQLMPGQKGWKHRGVTEGQLQLMQEAANESGDAGFQRGVAVLNWMHDLQNFPLFAWPTRLLTTTDEFFKTAVTRMEYHSQQMGKAIDSASDSGKPVQEVFEALVKDELSRNFTKDWEVLNADLIKAAKEVTFQTQLEGWAKNTGDFIEKTPVLKPFFPFIRTGHNILAYSATHVPLLNKFTKEYNAVMNGTDEYAKAMMKGRMAFGQLLTWTTALAAVNGTITGNGPPDPQERKVWLQSHRPRSIRLPGGNWFDYSRLEPFGFILSSVADLVDMTKRGSMSENRINYLAGYITYSIANNVTNKTYLQGLVPLGRLLTPGWQGTSQLALIGPETANNFIPLSSARRAFTNFFTPNMMEYEGQFQRLLREGSMGVLNLGAAEQYDWLDGSRIESMSGGLDALMPLRVTQRGSSVVRDALEDIEYDSQVIIKSAQGIKLSAQQKVAIQKLMGDSSLEKQLEAIVTNPEWQAQVRDYKRNYFLGGGLKRDEPFYQQIHDLIMTTRNNALQYLRTQDPDLNVDINQLLIDREDRRIKRRKSSKTKQRVTSLSTYPIR